MLLPNPVHHHSRRQRMILVRDPFRQRFPPLARRGFNRRLGNQPAAQRRQQPGLHALPRLYAVFRHVSVRRLPAGIADPAGVGLRFVVREQPDELFFHGRQPRLFGIVHTGPNFVLRDADAFPVGLKNLLLGGGALGLGRVDGVFHFRRQQGQFLLV